MESRKSSGTPRRTRAEAGHLGLNSAKGSEAPAHMGAHGTEATAGSLPSLVHFSARERGSGGRGKEKEQHHTRARSPSETWGADQPLGHQEGGLRLDSQGDEIGGGGQGPTFGRGVSPFSACVCVCRGARATPGEG